MKTTFDSPIAQTQAPMPRTAAEAERLQVLTLVEQFEGMLLSEMLRDIRAGDEDEEAGFGLGASTMTDTMQGEFGLALSRAGGLGLGEMLAAALLRKTQPAADSTSAVSPAPAESVRHGVPSAGALLHGPSPAVAVPTGGGPAAVVPEAVAVSSGYGWRSDPFSGRATFHKGIDLAAAYGTEVRAFGGGVVRSAGERSGYGLTVVVDHGGGRETLYAHLSTVAVAPGDTVDAGQPIARSGNSGRATGAHLHFEAREFGRPVDAGRLAAAWSGRMADAGVGGSDD
ncbi:MAG: peptidoglycan DD-metalloendopeptidase family protein [Acidobacteria bacterium]|nr:peptidoglycan DD-metalloendopeptidase family protein [Acidobacteriota bacterium]